MNNQGITSLSRPKSLDESYGAMQQKMGQVPSASQAVNKALDNITPMLSRLDNKTLGLLLQLTQYLKDHKSKYKELMAKLAAKGSIPAGVFPDKYDPKFLSVFALSVARAQKSREGMAAGGIADVAQHMKDQGRGKDTMLAHISPKEADLLRTNGGVGTLNPTTGLPEFNIFDDIGNGLKGVGDFIGDILRPVGNVIGDILRSPIGLAATAAAGMYFLGTPTVSALASSALPGDAALAAALPGDAVLAAAPEVMHLTPAAIEAGMGTPGYGFNASAAESGLFNPANIGAGAASDFPTSGLTAKDILKKGKDFLGKDTEKEKQSDPNEMIKLMAMLEMINSQNQPKDLPIEKLPDNSQLPYDSPIKKKSSYPIYTQTAADGGLMMDQRYDIGGITAERAQTDYLKQMQDPAYRPGQGGISYFAPLKYQSLADMANSTGAPLSTAGISALAPEFAGFGGTRSSERGPSDYGSGKGLAQFGGSGFTGATTDKYGDSGPLEGAALFGNKVAAFLGNLGLTSLSDAIAKNVDTNYGHEGRVGMRKALEGEPTGSEPSGPQGYQGGYNPGTGYTEAVVGSPISSPIANTADLLLSKTAEQLAIESAAEVREKQKLATESAERVAAAQAEIDRHDAIIAAAERMAATTFEGSGAGRDSDGNKIGGGGGREGPNGPEGRGDPGGDRNGWGRGGGYAYGGGITALAQGGMYNLGSYSDGGRLLRGPGDGVSDGIPAIIGNKQPARLANGEFVIPARIVSELGNGSTDAGAKRLYEMMDRIQKVRRKTKNVAANTKAAKYLPA